MPPGNLPVTIAACAPSAAWALRLPAAAAASLAPLRLRDRLEVAEDHTARALWLRGPAADDELSAQLRALPADHRYACRSDGRLQPHGSLLASERLPELAWQPLHAWLQATFPAPQRPADLPAPLMLALVRAYMERRANAALVAREAWLAWMLVAPQVRLARLRFAAAADGRCLVLGDPPPSIAGRPCVNDGDVVVPAGFSWKPAVSAATVRRTLGAPGGSIVWWDETGACVLGAELFVPASRSGARAMLAETSPARPS